MRIFSFRKLLRSNFTRPVIFVLGIMAAAGFPQIAAASPITLTYTGTVSLIETPSVLFGSITANTTTFTDVVTFDTTSNGLLYSNLATEYRVVQGGLSAGFSTPNMTSTLTINGISYTVIGSLFSESDIDANRAGAGNEIYSFAEATNGDQLNLAQYDNSAMNIALDAYITNGVVPTTVFSLAGMEGYFALGGIRQFQFSPDQVTFGTEEVPEPSTLSLLGFGLLGLFGVGYWRSRKQVFV